MTTHYAIVAKGIVQGVGFRPFVYELAHSLGLKGNVFNSTQGVIINVEGHEEDILKFLRTLQNNPPRLAQVLSLEWEQLPLAGYTSFEIVQSSVEREQEALIPADVSVCSDCTSEVLDPKDRHYKYPFTNCTNCGPRFTIVREMPYDRQNTSMAVFPMCEACGREYHDPSNRRFHAQPVACPECGPELELVDSQGKLVANSNQWQTKAWELLAKGKILAIKSLGGFHLACDASNAKVVAALRQRKGRDHKPFAVMCRDLEEAKRHCFVSEAEAELLRSAQAPIVVLGKRPDFALPSELAPGINTLGVMLPYTPLHLLLFQGPFKTLVMTSGNYSDLPLVKDNDSALVELQGIADYFLLHNREIVNRCDDSVVRVIDGKLQIWRRSRGYVPNPIDVPVRKLARPIRHGASDQKRADLPVVLAVGGEMKNTFCLLKGNQAFMSQHIGELGTLEAETHLLSSIENFERLLGVSHSLIACDMHPYYHSSRVAHRLASVQQRDAHFNKGKCLGRRAVEDKDMPSSKPFPVIPVQHHHAHLASCLADNGVEDEAIGVILDGTGYGTDGNLWGFEILVGNFLRFKREFHLAYVPLPGGEAAIREPWRTAVAYLATFLGESGLKVARERFSDRRPKLELIERMISNNVNCPLSSGCGRLFDAVSALLGVCERNTYEGQAAVELGDLTVDPEDGHKLGHYDFEFTGSVISPEALLRDIYSDMQAGASLSEISTRFHNTLAEIVVDSVEMLRQKYGLRLVALSGGTWQNPYLLSTVYNRLRELGYTVLIHRQVPCNDGGLALGQAVVAAYQYSTAAT